MKTPLLLVIAAIALGLLGYALWGSDEGAPPPTNDGPPVVIESEDPALREVGSEDSGGRIGASRAVRQQSSAPNPTESLDPSVRESLVGFVGRVVDPDGQPVPDSVVRLYRGAADIPFTTVFDIERIAGLGKVDLIVGENETDDEGRFHIPGAFPQGIFALLSDAEGDRPTFQLLQEAPGPGEVVDLGDVMLDDLAVLTGRIVDYEGNPVAGADVWSIDLPGALAAGASVFPFQRIDLDGYVITDEGLENVWTPPRWAVELLRDLPLPLDETDSQGRFRLRGVPKGSNVFVARSTGLEPYLQSALIVQQDEKDLGDIRLQEGEIAGGIVTDVDGEPVVGAEVVIAQATGGGAPVHVASGANPTDSEGRFEQAGFGNGDVIAAARRSSDDPWTISERVRVVEDLEIVLPGLRTLTVSVLDDETEEMIEDVRFQLLRGHNEEAIQTAIWGLSQPISVENRTSRDEDGRYQLSDLPDGEFTLLAKADGYAAGVLEIDLEESQEHELRLPAPLTLEVTIVDPDGEPAKGTRVFVQPDGKPSFPEDGIVQAGKVNADGVIVIDEVFGSSVKVSAQHPAFGMIHGEFRYDDPSEHRLQFERPGRIEGFVFDGREPPAIGKYTIVVARDDYNREAALPDTPRLVTHAEDGAFRAESLRPGNYKIIVLESLSAMNSVGDLVGNFGMRMFMMTNDLIEREIEVLAGQTAEIRIDTTEGPVFDGPTVNVSGAIRIDGVPAAGKNLMAFGEIRRVVELDAAGQFDLGQMPVGNLWLTMMDPEQGGRMQFNETLWSDNYELTEGEPLYLQVDIQTAPIAGYVFDTSGAPAANAAVDLNGREPAANPEEPWNSKTFNFSATTDQSGFFEIPQARAGTYSITVSQDGQKGQASAEVPAGIGNRAIRVQLLATVTIRGRVDLSLLELQDDLGWSYLSLSPVTNGSEINLGGLDTPSTQLEDDGSFVIDDVLPGDYRWQLWISPGDADMSEVPPISVGPGGLDGVVLQPRKPQPVEHPHGAQAIEVGGGR
ncbi:MAG: carboxypeptidase regulatory-like domain-containing protein [Planctomycetota bacterium]